MMRATRTLPAEYQAYATISLAKNKRLFILLNVLGLALFFGSGWLFVQIALLLRPAVALTFPQSAGSQFSLPLSWIWGAPLAFVLGVPLHEAAHGLFFWLFTRSRPRFAYKLL